MLPLSFFFSLAWNVMLFSNGSSSSTPFPLIIIIMFFVIFFSFSGKIEPNVLWFPFLSSSFFSTFSLLPACLVTGKMRVKEKINLGDLPCYFFDDVCLLYLVILDCLVAENCLFDPEIWIYIYSARHVSFSVRK